MVNYRHPARPARHRVTVGDVTPDLYRADYTWLVGDETVRVTVGGAPRRAAPVRPVSLVKRYV